MRGKRVIIPPLVDAVAARAKYPSDPPYDRFPPPLPHPPFRHLQVNPPSVFVIFRLAAEICVYRARKAVSEFYSSSSRDAEADADGGRKGKEAKPETTAGLMAI